MICKLFGIHSYVYNFKVSPGIRKCKHCGSTDIKVYNEGTMETHWENIGYAVENEDPDMEIWYPEEEVTL